MKLAEGDKWQENAQWDAWKEQKSPKAAPRGNKIWGKETPSRDQLNRLGDQVQCISRGVHCSPIGLYGWYVHPV